MLVYVRNLACFSLLFTTSVTLAAAPLSWKDCVKTARENNLELKTAQEQVRYYQFQEIAVGSDFFPQINGSMSASKSKSTLFTSGQDSYSAQLSATQLIFDGGKTGYDLEKARKNTQSYKFRYAIQSASVLYALDQAYISVAKNEELIRLNKAIAKRRQQQYELIALRYDAGTEHKGAMLQAKANMNQTKLTITSSLRLLLIAKKKLAQTMGLELKVPPQIAYSLIDPLAKETETPNWNQLVDQHPQLLQVKIDQEASVLNLRSVQSAQLPQVNANIGYGFSDSSFFPQKESWSMSMSLGYPLLDWGYRDSQKEAATSSVQQASYNERKVRVSLIQVLEESWTNLLNARDNLSVQKDFLVAVEERAKIAEAQYSAGQIAFDSWMLVENDYINGQKNYLNAVTDVLFANASWIYAKGGLLENEK